MLIKSISMANYLLSCHCANGQCKLIRIDKDRSDSNRLVFVFEDSQFLRQCMSGYQSRSKKHWENKIEEVNALLNEVL